ncbi:MAG: DUF4097 family beta strand repeat-containing protein [Longimicrobiales bacterium]|nr:DUF4097 family beta strand repeat-containing protein [Longimicrobiales bacterium]
MTDTLRRRPRALALALAFSGLAAVAGPGPSAWAQAPVEAGVGMAADGAIKIWNGGGSVRIEGWARDSLAVTGEVDGTAGGRFFLRAEGDVAKLGVEGDQAAVSGRLVVRLPAGATVWVRTTGADVTVRGLTGAVDIHTVSGDVDVESRPATCYAESMAGDLTLRLEAGIVRARAGTGRIGFTGTATDLGLSTVSGALTVSAPVLRRGRFTTVDGALDFTGDVRTGGALVFETHSGDIGIRLPRDVAADLRLSTFGGALRIGWDGAPAPDAGPGRRAIQLELGDGGAEVEARSYSGDVVVTPRDER